MPKRSFKNQLNNLDPKQWLKFQKSWFIHNPPPRQKEVLRHPAKFPETLVKEFIEFFTKKEQVVFDPMVGTGSTNIAALRAGRHCYGIELNHIYADIARNLIQEERDLLGAKADQLISQVISGDAKEIPQIVELHTIPTIDYVITSPPYWNILQVKGAATQSKRRAAAELDVTYSNDPSDLGNIQDYDQFIEQLVLIYKSLKPFLKPRAYITIIVKNIKKGGKIYPLAWNLALRLSDFYLLKDERIWCQENIRLAPYGLGNAWVSNIFHHYCLQLRNE
jgi:DNA modification methylase